MSNRTVMTSMSGGLSSTSGGDHNQPIDLAQKPHSVRISEGNVVKAGTPTLIHFETQIIASNNPTHVVECKPGPRNESSLTGPTVALVSRQSQGSSSGNALNLMSPNTSILGPGTTLRSISHPPTSTFTVSSSCTPNSPPSAHAGYHIPKGPAVVANIGASRPQGLASIVRTAGQTIGTLNSSSTSTTAARSNFVGQRAIPISSSGPGWINRNTSSAPAVINNKLSATSASSRAVLSTARSQSSSCSVASYPGNTLHKIGSTLRSPSAGVRSGISEVLRVQAPKGVQISHNQKYIASSTRGITSTSIISSGPMNATTCPNICSPSSTLVTSLASSGTTITPHPPPLRPQTPTMSVRITAPASMTSQVSTQSNATIGGISLTTTCGGPTCGAIINHPQSHVESHHIPIKTPIVKAPLSTNLGKIGCGPVGGAQLFSGSKIFTQSQPGGGSTLTVAQISNIGANHKSLPHSLSRTTGISRTSTGSLAKIVQPGSGAATITTIASCRSHPNLTVTCGPSQGDGSSSSTPGVVLQRATQPIVAVPGGNFATGERIVTTTTLPQYNIATPSYYFESSTPPNTFPVNSAPVVPHNVVAGHFTPSTVSSGPLRVASGSAVASIDPSSNHHNNAITTGVRPNSSPRPSILRKRPDFEGAPMKAAKNLSGALSLPVPSPPQSPKRPDDSGGNGNVSSGSATMSANSSPGMHIDEESNVSYKNIPPIKGDPPEDLSAAAALTPTPNRAIGRGTGGAMPGGHFSPRPIPVTLNIPKPNEGVSPRKKPRKQKLMGNELQEAQEDMEKTPSLKKFKKGFSLASANAPILQAANDVSGSRKMKMMMMMKSFSPDPPLTANNRSSGSGSGTLTAANRRPHMSLMNSYRQTWKARHNHFVRHAEVRTKEERRKPVNEIANQKLAFQRVNGWKVAHVSGQVEDLVDLEGDVVERLRMILGVIEKRNDLRNPREDYEKDVNLLSELVKANLQRSKIIRDQMSDAKNQMSKIFDHKANIVEIMTKYNNKRSIKKREKM